MGNPVIHFEVTGKDGARLASFFSDMFGWQIDVNNPLGYGVVAREQNLGKDDVASAAGSVRRNRARMAWLPSMSGVPDVEASLAKADELGGSRLFGPAEVPGVGLTPRAVHRPRGASDRAASDRLTRSEATQAAPCGLRRSRTPVPTFTWRRIQ